MKIKTAVIPAAGLGSRFLPTTKALPKEMLPIVDVPTLQLIIEEAKRSGITRIILIISKDKEPIKKHFREDREYEAYLRNKKQHHLADKLNQMCDGIVIEYAYQDEQKGLGHALYCAKDLLKDEPFALMLGDDLMDEGEHDPVIKQLMNAYEEVGMSIIGVQEVPAHDVPKYGIVGVEKVSDLMKILTFVEKPKLENAPSNIAALGRYVLTPAIFKALEITKEGANGEIQLTDALMLLEKFNESIYALKFKGRRFDVGDKVGYVLANLHYILKDESVRDIVLEQIKKEIL